MCHLACKLYREVSCTMVIKKKCLNKFTTDNLSVLMFIYFKDKDIQFSNVPSVLSYQVTKLGIFSHEEVNELLCIESTNLRLQYELEYLNKNVRNVGNRSNYNGLLLLLLFYSSKLCKN